MKTTILFYCLSFALALLLNACGGGGGGSNGPAVAGSSIPYTGNTVQATVDSTNAKVLADDAYQGMQNATSPSGAVAKTADLQQSPGVTQLQAIFENTFEKVFSKSTAKTVAATVQDSVTGYSGSFSYNISYNDADGSFSGTGTYLKYKPYINSASVSGDVSFSGVLVASTRKFTSLNITMNSVTAETSATSLSLGGSMAFSTTGATKTLKISVVMKNNITGKTYQLKDFTYSITGNSLTISGTYYDHDHGYVIIATEQPITASYFDASPSSGSIVATGSNGTKARLTFSAGGSKTLEVDTGSGTYVTTTGVSLVAIPYGTYEGTIKSNGVIGSYISVSILTDGSTYGVITSKSGVSGSLIGTTSANGTFSYSYQFYNDLNIGTADGIFSYSNTNNDLAMLLKDTYNGTKVSYSGSFPRTMLKNVATQLSGTYALKSSHVVLKDGTTYTTADNTLKFKGYFKISSTSMLQGGMINDTKPFKASCNYSISGSTITCGASSFSYSYSGVQLQTIVTQPTYTETDTWVKVSDGLTGGTILYKTAEDNTPVAQIGGAVGSVVSQ